MKNAPDQPSRTAPWFQPGAGIVEALFTHSTDLVLLLDAAGEVRACNPAAREALGALTTAGAWTPAPIQTLIHPDDALRMHAEVFGEAQPGASVGLSPFRVRGQAQRWRWLEGTAVNLLHDPEVQGLLVLARDVTARVVAERLGAAQQQVAAALSTATTADDVVAVILQHALEALGAAAGGVLRLTPDGAFLELLGSAGYEEQPGNAWARVPLSGPVPAAEAIRTGQDLLLSASAWDSLYPQLPRSSYQAAAALVLNHEGRPAGALTLHFRDDLQFTPEHRQFMRALADQCAYALERATLLDRLRTSEARHRKFNQFGADLVSVISPEGVLTYTTDATPRLLGYPVSALVGQSAFAFIFEADQPLVMQAIGQALATPGQPVQATYRFLHQDGRWIWIESIAAYHPDDPEIGGILVNSRDVTHQMALRDELKDREAAFRHLFAHNPLPMWVYDLQTLRVLEVNDAAVVKYGYSRQEFLQLHLKELRPGADRDAFETLIHDLPPVLQHADPVCHLRRDGTPIDVIVHGHGLTFADRPARLVVVEDVTEQLAAQRALQESERKFRLMAENSSNLITAQRVGDPEMYISPAVHELLGYTPEQAARLNHQDVLHPDDLPGYRTLRRSLIRGQGDRAELALRVRHAQGHYVWLETSARVVRDPLTGRATEYHSSSRDVSARRQAEAQVQAQVERYRQLLDLTEALEQQHDPTTLAYEALERYVSLTGDACGFYLRLHGEELRVVHSCEVNLSLHRGLTQGFPTLASFGSIGEVLRAGQPFFGVVDHGALPPQVAAVLGEFRSMAALPVFEDERLLGIFMLLSRRPEVDTEARRLLAAIAERVSVALERRLHMVQLASSREETLRALGLVLEYRDYETAGHTDRVVRLTERLARALGFSGSELDALRWGAYLHDTGKVAIPDSILRKPGKLDAEEWAVIQQHPVIGYELLQHLPNLPASTLEVVRHHHERWDGTGYPAQLAGEAIPLAARLFAVIDVYDALTDRRPYKRAWTSQEALAEIERTSGSHFDPQVARAFLELMASEHPDEPADDEGAALQPPCARTVPSL
ncbi:PAS domain S-box protein [Deinococcus sonorensis]|uniref:PAS domain S-box protein n=2 Tax=Deinococcus sonorensis TaxID=309891 RepID=A0AAU7U4S7_9DEIO